MEYHDNSEPAYRDYAQIANNEGAYIPMEDVDAALRRIDRYLGDRPWGWWGVLPLKQIVREERERLGLPKGVKA